MNKIEIYQNGEYRYTAASKTIKEQIEMIKSCGWLHWHTVNGWIKTEYKPSDKITGCIVGKI